MLIKTHRKESVVHGASVDIWSQLIKHPKNKRDTSFVFNVVLEVPLPSSERKQQQHPSNIRVLFCFLLQHNWVTAQPFWCITATTWCGVCIMTCSNRTPEELITQRQRNKQKRQNTDFISSVAKWLLNQKAPLSVWDLCHSFLNTVCDVKAKLRS